ncbi:hypothetical protein AAVH_26809 [Aphelenchoides avenae]|nr:hypothetical protein AAVH_26809 [Aphelenchus avenae]
MQANLPDDPLMRETIASLGPGAKDSTIDDLTAWIRQLEELCVSKDTALAKLQSKPVKGYPPLPKLHMEKVSSKKKNARGEARLRLSVERAPVLVLLTITDLHGVTRTLRAVAAGDNDLTPIKHPASTIEATAVPYAPNQLLERLRLVEAKIKEQRGQHLQQSASPQPVVEEASAQRQADGVRYMTKRIGGQVIEYSFDPTTGAFTTTSRGCSNPNCDDVNCTAAPFTVTYKANGEVDIALSRQWWCRNPRMLLAPTPTSFHQNPRRQREIGKSLRAIFDKRNAITDKLETARLGEKQRLLEEPVESEKTKELLFVAAETGGWMRAPPEEITTLLKKAKKKDPIGYEVRVYQYAAALDEYEAIEKKLEPTSNQTKRKQLGKLLDREEIKFDGVMNEIAAIANGSVKDDSEKSSADSICKPKPLDGKITRSYVDEGTVRSLGKRTRP